MNPEVFEQKLSELCEYRYSSEHGGLVVTKLFKDQTPCEWGGAGKGCHIESRLHKEIYTANQISHWRHKCTHCSAYINPHTRTRAMLKASDQHELRQFYAAYKRKD